MDGRADRRSYKEGEAPCDVCQRITEGGKESENGTVVVEEEEEEADLRIIISLLIPPTR
jgi:hypothetical protein